MNSVESEYYEETRKQALLALKEYPGGLQVGGGITADNAASFIEAGASAVIVTSYVFRDGKINYENLDKLVQAVGREHVVLDLSCRYREDGYYIVTDRWQKFTDEKIDRELLDRIPVRNFLCMQWMWRARAAELRPIWSVCWASGVKFPSPMRGAFTALKIWMPYTGLETTG